MPASVKEKRKLSFKTILFGYNSIMVLIILALGIGFFLGMYAVVDDMENRIGQYMVINKLSKELREGRDAYAGILQAVHDSNDDTLSALVTTLHTQLEKADKDASLLVVPYEGNPDKYFLSRAILNGIGYLEDFSDEWGRNTTFTPEVFAKYYQGLSVFNYLLGYVNTSYLSAAVASDAVAQTRNMQQVRRLRFGAIILAIVLSIVCFLITAIVTERLTWPLGRMVRTAADITQGNLETPDLSNEGPREIAFLASSMNQMKASLQEQMALEAQLHHKELEQVKMTRELERVHFLSLQAQINPHFLFNTLNTISHTALFEHADNTVSLINSLASMFRYTLEFTDEVPLSKELEFVRQYLEIQHARFGERLGWTIDCPETCASCVIPPLIIQPFVENAVIHGLEPLEEGGKVTIGLRKIAGQRLEVTVEDNGVGIKPSDLMEKDNAVRSHVGISNIRGRLRVFYQGKAALTIAPLWESHGTLVTLVIPLKMPSIDVDGEKA